MTDIAYYNRMMQTVEHIKNVDHVGLAAHYITDKNFLHAFPSDHVYTYKIGPNKVKIEAGGYFAFLTVDLAAKTLSAFQQKNSGTLDFQGYSSITKAYPQRDAATGFVSFGRFD